MKIDKDSPDSITSGLDFFNYPCTNISLSKTCYREFQPLNAVHDPPFVYQVPPSSSYPDFKHMYLKTEVVVKKILPNTVDEVNIEAADNISLIQAAGANFIRNLKVNVNGKEISNYNNMYSFKQYIDMELNYSKEAKDTHLALSGYYPDGPDQNAVAGAGFVARKGLITEGKTVEFISRIDADLFNMPQYFINMTPLDFIIHINDAKFMFIAPGLAANTQLIFRIKTAKLYIMMHDLIDGLATTIKAKHIQTPVKYHMKRSEIKSVFLARDLSEINQNVFSAQQIPRRVIVGLLSRADYDGDVGTSPFNFKPFDMNAIRIEWNGMQNPNVSYELDYANDIYARAYYDAMGACGYAFTPNSNGITKAMYKSGWNFYVFNLTTNLEDDKCAELIREGNTSLFMRFGTPVPDGGLVAVVYGEFDCLLTITNDRVVSTDLSA